MLFRPDDLKKQLVTWSSGGDEVGLTSDQVRFLEYYGLHQLPGRCALYRWSFCSWQLALYRWQPLSGEVRGTVWLWHGLFDHVALYRHVLDVVLQAGYEVIAVDLPGHGLSSGRTACIDDFSSYQQILMGLQQELGAALPQPWLGLGQSTGGGILLQQVMEQGSKSGFHGLFLWAPLVRPASFLLARSSYYGLGHWLRSTPRKFRQNSSDAQFLDFVLHKDPLQPKLLCMAWVGAMLSWEKRMRKMPISQLPIQIIQGEKDQTVDWRYNLTYIRHQFPQAQILLLSQASHQLVNESDDLRRPWEHRLRYFLSHSHSGI
ncbi:MAG: alpha/beta hydrolase [Pseudomonadales bacterium]|nr:alpha/beta hydrolase [Pseudomonadales bacterium]